MTAKTNLRYDIAAFIFALLFLLSGLVTLSRYGISWDEGLGNFFFGNRYAQYVTSFDPQYLDFDKHFPEDQPGMLQLEEYTPYRERPYEFPGLVDTLSASFMRVFAYQLHLVDPVDAFHSFTVVLTALYLLCQYFFVARLFNRPVALASILLLGTYPRFWGDMHFNPKDVPETIFFALTIFTFVLWTKKPSLGSAVLPGLFLGLAFGVKANAMFAPVVLGLWLLSWLAEGREGLNALWGLARKAHHLVVMGLTAGLAYWASWPLLYTSPSLVRMYFEYIFSQGSRQGKGVWSFEPLRMFLSVTPEVFLVALGMGLLLALFWVVTGGKQRRLMWLLLIWFSLPILRISLPISVNFDGIRHYLEFLPAATILAAVGFWHLAEKLGERAPLARKLVLAFAGAAFVVNLLAAHLAFDPYQYIYFNHLSGGAKGAATVFAQGEVTDYWAVSYREGLAWLNQNAEKGALVDVAVGDYLVMIPSRNWLRPDLKIVSARQVQQYRGKDKTIYILHITRPSFYREDAKLCQGVAPVYEKLVDGVSVMQIHLLSKCEQP